MYKDLLIISACDSIRYDGKQRTADSKLQAACPQGKAKRKREFIRACSAASILLNPAYREPLRSIEVSIAQTKH